MKTEKFSKINGIKGDLKLPGDKSVSHRAVIFSAMAEGESVLKNLSKGEDVRSTLRCVEQLGAEIKIEDEIIRITGCGINGFSKPASILDAGNSGTTARLLSGVLSAQKFETTITGDASLKKRPMQRIIAPLSLNGCSFEATEANFLPMKIIPAGSIKAIEYEMTVASAQVKSAVLLAGLHSEEQTRVIEKKDTRNHTEQMLGLPVHNSGGKTVITSSAAFYPKAADYYIPSDISTAAFFIVLALASEESALKINNVLLNPGRSKYLDILTDMGADLDYSNKQISCNEPFADITVRSSDLKCVKLSGGVIPSVIDEIPILSAAGLFAAGEFEVRDAAELRVKESDRIKALCHNYKLLGLNVDEYDDGFRLSGEPSSVSVEFESFGDHRIAMTFAVVSMLLKKGGSVKNFDCAAISNPDFIDQINQSVR